MKKSWNAALNMFLEIKEKAAASEKDLWAYDRKEDTCISYWLRLIGGRKYDEIMKELIINESGDLLLLRYSHIGSAVINGEKISADEFWNLYDGLYRECRSVVVDIVNDCLVLTPFRKFRNINECEETSYENIRDMISHASCVEFSDKLDGSMQSARCYKGQIVMAGSQALDAGYSWRLEDGKRMLESLPGYEKMLRENPDTTFIFEYISRKDRHVVQYDTEGLFLTGARDVTDGREVSYREVTDYACRYGIPAAKVFDKTLDEVMAGLDDKPSSEAEGFVLNIDGFKVKIKYNDYVFMHKTLGSMTSMNLIIDSISEGRFDDLYSKIPAPYKGGVAAKAEAVRRYKEEMEKKIDEAYSRAPKGDRKEFMIWVSENVDRGLQGFVREKYLGRPYNVLKNPKYVKGKI